MEIMSPEVRNKNGLILSSVIIILIAILLVSSLFYFNIVLGDNKIVGEAILNFKNESNYSLENKNIVNDTNESLNNFNENIFSNFSSDNK